MEERKEVELEARRQWRWEHGAFLDMEGICSGVMAVILSRQGGGGRRGRGQELWIPAPLHKGLSLFLLRSWG